MKPLDEETKKKIGAEFAERTGLAAPGSIGELGFRDGKDRLIRDLAFRGYLAELEQAGRLPTKVTPIHPDTTVPSGAVRFDGKVGDVFMLKGWRFRIDKADEGGMYVVPEGPANRVARRRAERA